MRALLESPLTMFLALVALYSPVASVSSYFPIVSKLRPHDQRRLALGLFIRVSMFALIALLVGTPLLTLLGLTTAALTVTGGIALMYAGVPLMRGIEVAPPPAPAGTVLEAVAHQRPEHASRWRSVMFMPVTFPLTVGGGTFALLVSFRAQADDMVDVFALSIAGLAYAAVTGLTVFASGYLERHVTEQSRVMLERVAGILLTSIAVSLLASGISRMVVDAVEGVRA